MLDTNVLYDLYTNSDRFELVSSVIAGQMCCISYSVYLEIGSLIKRDLGSKKTSLLLLEIREVFEILKITDRDEEKALQIMQKYEFKNQVKEYTFADALQLAQAESLGYKLYTSDQSMSNYKGANVVVI